MKNTSKKKALVKKISDNEFSIGFADRMEDGMAIVTVVDRETAEALFKLLESIL